MAKFIIKDSQTGKTLTISGDSAPTEQELEGLFTQAGLRGTTQTQTQQPNNIVELLKRAFVTPFTETGKVVGGAGFETLARGQRKLAGKDPFFREDGTPVENPFLSMRELEEINRNPLGFLGGQVGRSAQIVSLGIPVGGGGAATTAGRVVQAALRGGAVGAIRGFTSGDEEIVGDKTEIGERLQNTLAGAGTGAVVGGGLQAGGEAVRGAFSWLSSRAQPLKEKLANQILGLTKTKVKVTPEGSNWLSTKLVDKLDDGTIKPGGYNSIRQQAQTELQKSERQINELVTKQGVGKSISTDKLMAPVEKLASQAQRAGKTAKANAIRSWMDSVKANNGATLDAGQALNLRRTMEADFAGSMFNKAPDEISGAVASSQREFANGIRNWLRQKNVVGGQIGDLLTEESIFINLRDAMTAQLQKAGRPVSSNFLNLLNLPLRAASATVGRPGVTSRAITAGAPQLPQGAQNLTNPLIQMLTANQ